MFRRSLLVKLALVFLLTTTMVAGVNLYHLRVEDSASRQLISRLGEDSDMLSGLENARVHAHEIIRHVSDYRVDVLAGKQPDAKERTADIRQAGERIAREEAIFRQVVGSTASRDSVASIFAALDELAVDAEVLVSNWPVSPVDAAAQADALSTQQQTLDSKLSAEIDSVTKLIDAEMQSAAAKSADTTRTSILLESLAVLAAVVIGLLFAELLGRSIRKIQQGAERIANGDFSRPIEVKARDEVGLLADAFNKMAVRLRDSYARLALERQRDETLLESMSDGLIATDESGNVVALNNTAIRLLELSDRSQLVGKPVEDVLVLRDRNSQGGDDIAAIQERPESKAFALGRPVGDVYAYNLPSGKKILISVGASPIILDGRNTGAVMIIRDVTREQEVDRMKTEFISLASHQLRTPLSAIKWFVEMLANGDAGKLTPDQTEFAKNIADSTERMIDLVNSLLNISRIESGRIMVEPKPTDLNELVSGIVNDLKAKIDQRQQSLAVSIHKELPKVNLDPRLIGQVYLNLLTNAIKYTPKGGEISVFVSRKGDELVSQVTDNGYGIPKTEQSKMFQKFFRATNVSKIETDGTGLGLYLIKAIIESSGGRIWFESEEGKGTTFWFSLPMSGMKPKEGEVTLDQ